MSDNDVNDSNCDKQECSSCCDGGSDAKESCCGSGNSHKQQDLKTLIFVLVLILAGAVAAHSIMNKGKSGSGCGPGGCRSGQVQDGAPVGCCPSGEKSEEAK